MRGAGKFGFSGAPAAPSEANLVARAQQGEEAAFRGLYDAHKRRVYSLFLQITSSPAEAEDLTREAFLQAFRSISTLSGDSAAFSTLLDRLVGSAIFTRLRNNHPRQAVPSQRGTAEEGSGARPTRAMTRQGQELLIPAARPAP